MTYVENGIFTYNPTRLLRSITKISDAWCIMSRKFKVIISALKKHSSSHILAESDRLQTTTKSVWYTVWAGNMHHRTVLNIWTTNATNNAEYAFICLSNAHGCNRGARHWLPIPLPWLQLGAFPNPVKRGHIFPRLSPPYWARMNPMNPSACCRTDWLWKNAPADTIPAHANDTLVYTGFLIIYIHYAIISNCIIVLKKTQIACISIPCNAM